MTTIRMMAAALLLAGLGVPAMAAPAAGWAVTGTQGKPVMSRTFSSMTIRYWVASRDTDNFTVTVAGCDGSQWSGEGAANPEGGTAAERAEAAALDIGSVINDAGSNCPGSANLEDGIMSGFGAAFAKFEAMKK